MWFLRFLLGVLLFCIGYATRVVTDEASMPRDLIKENEELTRANMDLIRSNQALREMLHQHVADIKNRPGYEEREADRQRRYGDEYQRKRRGAYKKQNRPELALRTAESKY